MTTPENSPQKGSFWENKIFLSFFGALFVLVFLIMLIVANILTQVEDIEEQLKYRPLKTYDKTASIKTVVSGQTVYVPVYSHIYAKGGKPFLLETTLSIRNIDPGRRITIQSVKYFDTSGKMVKSYLGKPVNLSPLATIEFLVEQRNIKGGSGANFLVEWVSGKEVNPPHIEAVMIGIEGQRSISFVTAGVPLNSE